MRRFVLLAVCALSASCASEAATTVAERAVIASSPTTSAVMDDAPVSTGVSTAVATSPPTTAPAPTTEPTFSSSVETVAASRLRFSWRPGCPVPPSDLRLLHVTFWGFDDRAQQGELVVQARYAEPIVSVFAQLFDARFPIERMELVDVYEGDDVRSMVANNTSGFNCREVAGSPGVLSQHALGNAIDVNPLINPWVHSGKVDPPEGAQYADRAAGWKGAIYADDVVVRAFASIGWGWGGYWPGSPDYQHFSANGQ
jgi:hypothetical protein